MEYIWIAAMVFFIIVEAATISLVSIWFAFGSLAAMIAALAGGEIWLQIVLFMAVSAIVLMSLRPIAGKYLSVKRRPTNADRVLGQVCAVTEPIDNVAGTGAVFVDGKTWTARSRNGVPIDRGALVRPVAIQGVKLIVEAVREEAKQ